jgi:hypothetical protein
MSRTFTMLVALALLASVVSVATATTYPPGPPYRSCPDSVTLFQVQRSDTLANACFPALNDTVLGIRGVIVGFRQQSTGRIYMENSNGADYNAVQIYTRNIHYENLGYAVGDSISVLRGVMGVYQEEYQIAGNSSSSDTNATFIRIQKIAPGTLPPERVGTTSTYNWAPVPTNHPGRPSVASLVRVEGPLRVARRGPGAGLYSETYWLCVNADGSAPGDSICIDGGYMTTTAAAMVAPAEGTIINWVRGIMRRAAPGGTDCLLISLRDVNDISVQAPPNLTDAYPIAENQIRLQFDKNLHKASAENKANYKLASNLSGSTVNAAVLVGGAGSRVDLTITDVLPRLSLESIQSRNIGSATCPACLSTQQSQEFILGVLSIAEVQAPLPDSLIGEPCLDKSRFAGLGQAYGPRLTVRAVVSAKQSGALTFIEDAANGKRSGVAAYQVNFPHLVGHQYLFATNVQEYYGMTELREETLIGDEGAVTPPAPLLTTCAVLNDRSCDPNQETDTAEDFEGVLVRVEKVKVVGFDDPWVPPFPQGGSFRVAGPYPACTDTIRIDSGGDTHFPGFTPELGMILNVNGSFYFTDDRVPQIWPRGDSDISDLTDVGPGTTLELSLRVVPNPGTSHRISFVVPRREKVDLAVYDVLGRRVVVLAKGELPAGAYTRDWNGRSGDGTQTPAGVYFYRLAVGKEVRTFRAVRLN